MFTKKDRLKDVDQAADRWMPAEAVLGERLSNHIQYLQLGKEPSQSPEGENIILFLNSERLKT